MTEKIGPIKNPLTIIAIFAGIAEVSGTIVLPFITPENQQLFTNFLIFFPSVLVILFFLTLNFNNKVLYAPSDYKDESNYIKINKYDLSKQKTVQIKVSKDSQLTEQVAQLTEHVAKIDNQMMRFETLVIKSEGKIINQNISFETKQYNLLVTNFENVRFFLRHMKRFELHFEVYYSPNEDDSSYDHHRSIWLGTNVPIDLAKRTIKLAKEFYPHLEYIKMSEDGDPDQDTIYIGGSTDSAVNYFNRLPLADSDFNELQSFSDIESFHMFIEKFGK